MNQKVLRVANIIEEGRLGGPQKEICQIAKYLERYNIDVTVIYPSHDSERFHKLLSQNSVREIPLPLHRLGKGHKIIAQYVATFVFEVLSLVKVINLNHFDLIHCSGGSWQYKAIIASKLARVPMIWHLNDTFMPKYIYLIFRFFEKFLVNNFVVSCQRTASFYLNNSKRPPVVIHPPVDTHLYKPESFGRDGYISSFDGLKIVTIGNIVKAKGFQYFIQMAYFLKKKYSNLNFFIIGPPQTSKIKYYERLKGLKQTYALDNLHFYGYCEQIGEALNAADIFVCTSIHESGPMALFEAMSMEKPIVSTNVGDVSAFLEEGRSGFIVPVKDSQALAEKVGILVENCELRRRLGKKARQTAVALLDVNISARKHVDYYRQLVSRER